MGHSIVLKCVWFVRSHSADSGWKLNDCDPDHQIHNNWVIEVLSEPYYRLSNCCYHLRLGSVSTNIRTIKSEPRKHRLKRNNNHTLVIANLHQLKFNDLAMTKTMDMDILSIWKQIEISLSTMTFIRGHCTRPNTLVWIAKSPAIVYILINFVLSSSKVKRTKTNLHSHFMYAFTAHSSQVQCGHISVGRQPPHSKYTHTHAPYSYTMPVPSEKIDKQ